MIQRNNKSIKHIYKGDMPKLPDAYQEVEYLESSGTQYIDTGVLPDDQTEGFTIKVDYVSLKEEGEAFQSIFGQTETSSNAEIGWFIYISRDMFIAAQSGKLATTLQTKINTGERHSYSLSFGKLIVDNTSYNINKGTTYVYNYSISLFARVGAYIGGYSYSIGRIYSARIYNNINVIREFIPCYRKSDNEPGMYDLVNDVFYTNAGIGSFTVGSDVVYKKALLITDANGNIIHRDVPSGYTMLSYLDFDGSQAVPTNIHLTKNSVINVSLSLSKPTGSNYGTVWCDRLNPLAGTDRGSSFFFVPDTSKYARWDYGTFTYNMLKGDYGDVTIKVDKDKLYINGVLRSTATEQNPVFSQRGVIIGLSQGSEAYYAISTNGLRGNIKRLNIDGIELIPSANAQGVKGLYAVQTHTFYPQETVSA